MSIPTFTEIAAARRHYRELIAKNKAYLETMATETNGNLEDRLTTVSELDSAADTVWVAYITTDPSIIADDIFDLADLLEAMAEHQRRKFLSGLASQEHKQLTIGALKYLSGEITADELAQQAGTAVPLGAAAQRPTPEEREEARMLPSYKAQQAAGINKGQQPQV